MQLGPQYNFGVFEVSDFVNGLIIGSLVTIMVVPFLLIAINPLLKRATEYLERKYPDILD